MGTLHEAALLFRRRRAIGRSLIGACSLFAVVIAAGLLQSSTTVAEEPAAVFDHSTYSSPIAISADNKLLWSINPADDSVSVIRTDTNELIKNIKVGDEPQSVALDPGNKYAYVANAAGGSVTVIKITNPSAAGFAAEAVPGAGGQLITGAEPWNIVTSPDGKRVFVANSGQDTITVIDAKKQKIIGHVNLRNSVCNDPDRNRHFQPRGLAVTQDSSKLYVTRFLSFVKAGGQQGMDTGKEGLVCRLNIDTGAEHIGGYVPFGTISLAAQNAGFSRANEEAVAFPNQLQSIVIRGDQAYLPNIAASPSDPLVFDVETQAFVNRIAGVNEAAQSDAGALNLNLGARDPETGKKKLFFANQWGIAFTNQSGAGTAYAISAGADLLVKLNVAADGALVFTVDGDTTRYIDLNNPNDPATSGANAGKNPQGIVINNAGTTAYVQNFVSRNVSVVDLTNDTVAKVIQTFALPPPGSFAEVVAVGAEQFFSSRGHYNQPEGTTISVNERLSQIGWQGCASCHFKGWTDGVVWVFDTGPRKSIALNGTFDPQARGNATSDQRVLNYSVVRDEVHDFELNARNTSGPDGLAQAQDCSDPPPPQSNFDPNHGLLIGDTNAQLAPCTINNFAKSNTGRNEITVTLPGSNVPVKALEALNQWVRVAVRTPNGPLTSLQVHGGVSPGDVIVGRVLFKLAGCANCHGGNQWTSSIRDFVPPPSDAAEGFTITERTGTFTGNPIGAQYLNRFLRDINSFDLNVPGSGNAIAGQPLIGAVEKTARGLVNGAVAAVQLDALGKDYNNDGRGAGFSPPSLLGINALPPFYHNGACETLACVVADANHRNAAAKLPVDILTNPERQAKVVKFLESIDADTKPIE